MKQVNYWRLKSDECQTAEQVSVSFVLCSQIRKYLGVIVIRHYVKPGWDDWRLSCRGENKIMQS